MHRGYEKLTEVRTYPQVTTLVNRIDWLGSFANEVPFILAAEQLMEIEAPPRARHIRTILFEMARLANIVLFLGDLGVQLGAVTPAFFAFRDREHVLDQIESVTGGRFHPNFDRIGGLKDDLPKGWIADTKAVMVRIRTSATRSRRCSSATRSSRPAPAASASIPAEVALSYGLTGANLRASGIDWDLRRDGDVGLAHGPGRLEGLDPPRRRQLRPLLGAPAGDPRGDQDHRPAAATACRAGRSWPRCPRIIKVPAGEAYVATENPLGVMGYYLVSKGDLGPFRVKIRSASFSNVSIVPWLLRGVYVPDIITILASLYFILGDIDR